MEKNEFSVVTPPALVKQQIRHHHPLPRVTEEISVEEVFEDGRFRKKVVAKKVDKSEFVKSMVVSDFSLESMQAAGSLPDVPSHYTSTGNLDSTIAAVDAAASFLEQKSNEPDPSSSE